MYEEERLTKYISLLTRHEADLLCIDLFGYGREQGG